VAINAAWHARHRMPKNPTPAERLAWHAAHQRHCACRPTPAVLQRQLRDAAAKASQLQADAPRRRPPRPR
jgi:hypothetical protein